MCDGKGVCGTKRLDFKHHWIGLRDNLNRKPWFLSANIGFSCKIFHHPILWNMDQTWTSGFCLQQPSHGVMASRASWLRVRRALCRAWRQPALPWLVLERKIFGAMRQVPSSFYIASRFLEVQTAVFFCRLKKQVHLEILLIVRRWQMWQERGLENGCFFPVVCWQVFQLSSVSFSGRWRQQPVALQMPSHLRILVLVFRALPRLRLREQGLPTAIDLCRLSSQQDAQCQGRSWFVTFKPKAPFFFAP